MIEHHYYTQKENLRHALALQVTSLVSGGAGMWHSVVVAWIYSKKTTNQQLPIYHKRNLAEKGKTEKKQQPERRSRWKNAFFWGRKDVRQILKQRQTDLTSHLMWLWETLNNTQVVSLHPVLPNVFLNAYHEKTMGTNPNWGIFCKNWSESLEDYSKQK